MPKIAVILHTKEYRGDHAADIREVALFDSDALVSDLMLFLSQRDGTALELVRNVEPVTAKDEEQF